MEAVNPSFHLGRCCPLLKLQLSRVHHGSEEEGQEVTCQPEPRAECSDEFSQSSWDEAGSDSSSCGHSDFSCAAQSQVTPRCFRPSQQVHEKPRSCTSGAGRCTTQCLMETRATARQQFGHSLPRDPTEQHHGLTQAQVQVSTHRTWVRLLAPIS